MAFADIRDVRLFFTDEGDGGPPLLFVHGYTCDSHDWSWQLPHFAADRRVIAVDLRGHGRSTAPEHGTMDPVPVVQQILEAFDAPARSPALRTWQLRRAAGVPHHVLRQALVSQVKGLTLYSNSAPYLARRTCPVLTFYADPARAGIEASLYTDDRSRVVAWEGAGHWLHQERPAEFNALVGTWLAELRL